MAKLRGWSGLSSSGVEARGSFYSRYKNRNAPHTKENREFVNKHTSEVFRDVVWNGKNWEGVGLIGVEPKYANFSGDDKRVRFSPDLKPFKINKIIAGRKVFIMKKPVTLFKRR